MSPTFQPPAVLDVPTILPTRHPGNAVMRHFGPYPRGRTVLKTAGVYRTVDTPTLDDINAATEVYMGGHIHVVTQAVADALTAAGYGSGITA